MFFELILTEHLLYTKHLSSVGDIALNKIDRSPAPQDAYTQVGDIASYFRAEWALL